MNFLKNLLSPVRPTVILEYEIQIAELQATVAKLEAEKQAYKLAIQALRDTTDYWLSEEDERYFG